MKCKHTKRYSVKLRSGYVDGIGRTELLPVLHSTDQFWLADPTPKALIWCIGKVTKFTEAPKLWILPHKSRAIFLKNDEKKFSSRRDFFGQILSFS